MDELQQALVKLRSHLKVIKESFEEEERTYDYKFKHINEIQPTSRLVGPQTLKVIFLLSVGFICFSKGEGPKIPSC